MSVQRKRSPWLLTAAGVLLCALSLGLAGCGGDDSPAPFDIDGIVLPAGVVITPVQAQGQQGIPAGQGATIEVTNLDPTVYGGVLSARVTFPIGTSGQSQTFGIAILRASDSTLERLKASNPGAFNGQPENWTNVFEVLVGPVLADGTIDWQNPPNVALNFSVELTQAIATFVNSQLSGGRSLVAYRISTGDVLTKIGVAQIGFDFATRRISVSNLIGGRFFVAHIPSVHNQGGGGS